MAERDSVAETPVHRYLPGSSKAQKRSLQKVAPGLGQATIPALASVAGSAIFAGHRNSGDLQNVHSGEIIPTIASLSLPPGHYAIFAKLNLTRSDTTTSVVGNEVTCILAWGNDEDTAHLMVEGWKADDVIEPSTGYFEGATRLVMSLMITHQDTVKGDAVLMCCAGPADAEPMVGKVAYNDLRLIAIGADHLFENDL